jgi:hypothetical protein
MIVLILMDCPRDYEFSKRNKMLIKEEKDAEKIHCTQCGDEIESGHYSIRGGDEIYCDDGCLSHNYDEETYRKMYEDDEAYYTEI